MEAQDFANKLREAEINKSPIPPIREEIGIQNINLAYQIQYLNTQHRVRNGARIVGKKIGLTSKAVQKQLGVDQPDFGVLFHNMEILNEDSVSMQHLMQPKVEAEIAFVLGADVIQENLTIVDIINSIDYAVPAIEIVGSRIEQWNIKITDTIADNASASHFVIGHTPKMLDEFDVIKTKMQLSNNGELVSQGTGKNCLGSPLNAVLWLAKKMQEMNNPLRAGELIFSGALGPMVNVIAGDHLHASFEGLGDVSVKFSE